MSIPIDKLYHYIERVAKDIRGDNVIIYRFYPHGSKKLSDLTPLRPIPDNWLNSITAPRIYCYDQEPLAYDSYIGQDTDGSEDGYKALVKKTQLNSSIQNLRGIPSDIYDKSLLIHSEQRSANLKKYQDDNFITVYYWAHGLIARDWFRFAQYEVPCKNIKNTFLIYNRAWAGSREYRLKFIDLLKSYQLLDNCQASFNAVDPETGIHYTDHKYLNKNFQPINNLDFFKPTDIASSASADYDLEDYISTDIEVVLETLFDDDRLQLTEKILRPIALGQPFLLACTPGSLEYLRSYGFLTFSTIFDESYDTVINPVDRLQAIVTTMKEITNWSVEERKEKMELANRIAAYNRKHFFSNKFTNQVTDELKQNLTSALNELETTNTSSRFLTQRKILSKNNEVKAFMLKTSKNKSRQDILELLKKVKNYNSKHNKY